MSFSKEESNILLKISQKVKQIQLFLQETGLNDCQQANYFTHHIFQGKSSLEQGESVKEFYSRQIRSYLKQASAKHGSKRIALTHILSKLEIENGKIEIYEKEQIEEESITKVEKKLQVGKESIYKPRKLFDMTLQQEEGSEKLVRDLEQIRKFQRELQQSLMKTKLLKRMMQQRLGSDLEPFTSCLNGFQKLLTLESSG